MFMVCSLALSSRYASIGRIMSTEDFIRALLAKLPHNQVEGKKRLQKLVYLLKESGADVDATFTLKNFGPYSADVDNSAIFLTITGDLEESSKVVGSSGYVTTVFTLPVDEVTKAPELDPALVAKLSAFNSYTTIELEIAATVHYFESETKDRERAIALTRDMKPTKTRGAVVQKVPEILSLI